MIINYLLGFGVPISLLLALWVGWSYTNYKNRQEILKAYQEEKMRFRKYQKEQTL